MFDLMQYALIFYDFQLILAQMGGSAACRPWPAGTCASMGAGHALPYPWPHTSGERPPPT